MRASPRLLLILAVAAGLSGPAAAQTPLRPPGGFVAPPAPPPRLIPAPAPALPTGRLTLQGLPDRTDAAPACRAQCSRSRTRCEAADDDCAPVWNACLRRCAAAK